MSDARRIPIIIESTARGFGAFEDWHAAQSKSEWSTFRFVVHERVLDYLNCGWHIAEPDLGYHAQWSVLMQWLCACKPVEPIR